eukprot:7889216-Pyramimonas_sp.AAC.1
MGIRTGQELVRNAEEGGPPGHREVHQQELHGEPVRAGAALQDHWRADTQIAANQSSCSPRSETAASLPWHVGLRLEAREAGEPTSAGRTATARDRSRTMESLGSDGIHPGLWRCAPEQLRAASPREEEMFFEEKQTPWTFVEALGGLNKGE